MREETRERYEEKKGMRVGQTDRQADTHARTPRT